MELTNNLVESLANIRLICQQFPGISFKTNFHQHRRTMEFLVLELKYKLCLSNDKNNPKLQRDTFERKRSDTAVWHQAPHLTVYPRGHGDIPQHLRDRPNEWIVARLLFGWKENTTQNARNQICGQIAETQGRKTWFWGKTGNKVTLVLETLFFPPHVWNICFQEWHETRKTSNRWTWPKQTIERRCFSIKPRFDIKYTKL